MRRLLLVANPSASAFTGAALRAVTSILSDGYEVTTVWPNGPAESRQVAAEAADNEFPVVAAMGGDGIVHHVANGLAFTGTALAVIPAGTTNVVARILGLPLRPAAAAQKLLAGHRRTMTLAHVTTESSLAAQSEYAVFSLGVGLDADVVAVAEQRPQSKYHFSSINFASITVRQVMRNYRTRPADMLVECRGERVHASSVLIQVHDLYTYWGRVPLRLSANPGSGLTALALERVSALRMLVVAAGGLTRGDLTKVRGAHLWEGFDKLLINAEPAAPFQADGELLGKTDAIEITPAYDALQVIASAPNGVPTPDASAGNVRGVAVESGASLAGTPDAGVIGP